MLEMNQLNARWDRYLPLTVLLKHNVEQKDMQRVMESLREYYLAGRKVDKHNIRGMTDVSMERRRVFSRGLIEGTVTAKDLTSRKRREKEDRIGDSQPFRERTLSVPRSKLAPGGNQTRDQEITTRQTHYPSS
jgi:hypothetical protein